MKPFLQSMAFMCTAEAVVRLLHLNAPPNALRQSGDEEHYKVLVLDAFTRAIIAPLLRVNELRKHGITLHLSLETQRDPIPDTPSIYLVQANEETVKRIVSDAAAGLYDSFHLNFTPSIPAPLMDQLAGGVHLMPHGSRQILPYCSWSSCFLAQQSDSSSCAAYSMHFVCASESLHSTMQPRYSNRREPQQLSVDMPMVIAEGK